MEEGNASNELERDKINYNLKGNRAMATAETGEGIVITGISGSFPSSNNIHEFKKNLFNKNNMVLPNRRWDIIHPEIPVCSGTIPDIEPYDTGFFGVHDRQAQSLDTMTSLLLEKTVEAIFDAGLHPSDLQNTKTGVFVGICFSENDKCWFFDNMGPETYAMTGSERSMTAHRLSYFLKLKGPSFTTDTACSSSLYAFEHAYRSLRLGEIDQAIVGGTNMCFHPFVSLQFSRLGVLSKDGSCKAFDEHGDGYARSEAIGVILLQKSKDANRIYGEVIHVKTNCDGYKEQGITFPSKDAQRELLNEFYDECEIDRCSLSFLEAHGTGTLVGDPEECSAIDEVFTKGRKRPLLIGSVKSNIGHSEPASGVCSIIKSIIGMETGFIPPNIHYKKARPEIKGLTEGRMRVVTEKMPFEDDNGLVGINSFGFGGGNCHVLLRWNRKTKVNCGAPADNLPRLVCLSGRTEEAVESLLDSVVTNFDVEYITLLHNGFRKNTDTHQFRGYTIVSRLGETARSINYMRHLAGKPPKLYFAFGELNNWFDIGGDLMVLPAFSAYIQKVQKILASRNISISDVLLKKSPNKFIDNVVGSTIVHIGLLDLFRLLEIKPSQYLFGEWFSAYCDGILSLEEMINYTFSLSKALMSVKGVMEVNNNCNSQDKHDVNGNYIINDKTMKDHVKNGKNYEHEVGVILERIRGSSENEIKTIKHKFLDIMLKDLAISKSSKDNKKVKDFVYAVLSNDSQNIKENAAVLKIGNCPLGHLEDVPISSVFESEINNYLVEFLKGVGSLYEFGYNPQLTKLYPPVPFPVSRGTGMISPYFKWNHRRLKYIPRYNIEKASQATHGGRTVIIQVENHEWRYLKGHTIDGRVLFPATGYLYLVWETFAVMNDVPISVMQVCFENCRFLRATAVPKRGHFSLHISILQGTGEFEVAEGDSLVVTGKISMLGNKAKYEDLRRYQFGHDYSDTGIKLTTKDVYKELRLRGYNYKAEFRAIQECDASLRRGMVKWDDNWVTFMDNMLQMKILQADTRLLYVPTFIQKLTIMAKIHLELVNSKIKEDTKSPTLTVHNDLESGTIRCGGINIRGLIATSIARRKITGIPVLESYKFVPNITVLNTHQSIRVNTQIILENSLMYKVNAVELIDDFTSANADPLTPIIKTCLEDQPLIQPFLKILTKTPLEGVDIETEDKKLKTETDCLLVIGSNVIDRPDILAEAFNALTDNGFLLSRESHKYDPFKEISSDFSVFTVHHTSNETLVLLRKKSKAKSSKYINISSMQDLSWLPQLQNSITKEKSEDVVLYAQNERKNGIMGLVNCLRREPLSRNVRSVFMMDIADPFDPVESFYSNQLKKQMAVNVYQNGQWGTYRHLLLEQENKIESEHCFANTTVRGDLSSLKWIEGPLRHSTIEAPENCLIYVYYCALNFRDIMTASGKINVDVVTQDRLLQECIQGFEFSGRNREGKRVMGMVTHGALSSLVISDSYMTFNIPDDWSLEEAATVPVVYSTVIYALFVRGEMVRGESILIHSGTGGIGQAAIRMALHYGCTVFTTVGSNEKREFLKKTFPELKDHQIGNSHDESFEQMIFEGTRGRGVDLVLNSLAEEKLVASVRCLAKGGRFIEIGKFDMAINSHLNLLLFEKEASIQGIMLDQLFLSPPESKQKVLDMVIDGVKQGVIKPLNHSLFKRNELEQAFRHMATGKHMGKVLIQLREPEKELTVPPTVTKFTCTPRYFCDPEKVYIVTGGLGGFGLELADWLILRGARKVVLTSRKGVTTGYQNYRLNIWRTYGVNVKVSTASVTTPDGCKQLIEESLELGRIDAIFNLAVVLADSLFENQTQETFFSSFGPKAHAAEYLDELTRTLCPDLSEFVVFSSVSCGRGNGGQTNYGMSNSVMERICESRKQAGYPALAIEWGAIGDVGLVAEMLEDDTEIEISGTLQQRISNCLQVMDTLLRQNEAPIVSSMVVAEKRGINAADNVVDAVIGILGLNDSKSVSFHSTLAELGMDSMTAVEIKQVLERDFQIFLTAKDIRTMTLAKLKDIQNEKLAESEENQNVAHFGIELVFRLIGEEAQHSASYVEMVSKVSPTDEAPVLLMFPGIEGLAVIYNDLTKYLDAHSIGVQFKMDGNEKTLIEIAESVMPTVEKYFPDKEYTFVSYSFGTLVALEVVSILESRGYNGTLIIIDGSPMLMNQILQNLEIDSEKIFETALLCHLLSFYISFEEIGKHKEDVFKCSTWDDRVNLGIELVKHRSSHEANYLRLVANSIYRRSKALKAYTPSYNKLKSNVKLLKPTHPSVAGLPEDYGLSQYFEKPITIQTFDGNHVTILENEAVAMVINSCVRENPSDE